MLEKTYKLFEVELIEKEFQNTHHHLELRIIHDNLTSLNERHDRLLERYYCTENGPMQAEIKNYLDRYENEILELETNIKNFKKQRSADERMSYSFVRLQLLRHME